MKRFFQSASAQADVTGRAVRDEKIQTLQENIQNKFPNISEVAVTYDGRHRATGGKHMGLLRNFDTVLEHAYHHYRVDFSMNEREASDLHKMDLVRKVEAFALSEGKKLFAGQSRIITQATPESWQKPGRQVAAPAAL